MNRKRNSDSEYTNGEPVVKRSRRIQNGHNHDDDSDDMDDNEEGRAGRVLRVVLQNFMCHTYLEIDLNVNINYIIGRNGSGKSAILTALIIGLGGKATLTNRGASTKSFIKVGETTAKIEICLSNVGPMAYKPRIYGKQITVQRIIGEKFSKYKLLDENHKVVSNHFRDVRRLTEALNIQIDNPVCVLNQDTARTFLNTNDTTKKYQLFMKATNLENINEQYELGLQNERDIRSILKLRKTSLESLKNENDILFEKIKAIESYNELRTKQESLLIEIMWAKAREEQNKLLAKQEEVNKVETEVDKLESSTKNKNQELNDLTANKEAIQNQLREIRTEFENNQKKMDEVKGKSHKVKEKIFMKQKTIESIKKIIDKYKSDKKQLEQELNNIESTQPNKQKIMMEREQKLNDLQQKLVQTTNLLGTTENDLMQLKSAIQRKIVDDRNLKSELRNIEANTGQLKSNIYSLKNESDNSAKVYGKNMLRVLNAINYSKEQFSKLPVGPIGSYIKLKDKKWALAIEGLLGVGTLESFCVDNTRDTKILSKIFDSIYTQNQRKPTIICSKFFDKVHDITPNKTSVPRDCVALIDALKITNPVITNCLIDQLNIETILLTPTSEISMSLMSRQQNVPKNCSRTITIKGDQFYPDPSYRTYAGRLKVAKYLQANTSELVKQYENELKIQMNKIETIKPQQHMIENEIKELKNGIKIADDKLNSLNRLKMNLQNKMEEIRLEEMPTEKNLDIYKDELVDIEKNMEKKQHEIESIQNEIKEIETSTGGINNELIQLKKSAKEFNERMEPLMAKIDEIQDTMRELGKSSKYKNDKLQKLKHQLITLKEQLEIVQKNYEDVKKLALETSPEPDTYRDADVVIKEIHQVDVSLKEAQHLIGDSDTVRNAYERVSMKYISVKDLTDSVQETISVLGRAMKTRAREYHRLLRHTAVSIQEFFTGVLSVRQFKGTIEFDHEKKTLELFVVPQHGSQNAKHILSGGERSYSTVAFLMSLWHAMEYPFYFLDEFDVFMDKVNRRAVMDMLLEHGLDHKYLQYVFLTPQDISNVKINEHVTIHRMQDPERKQIHN